MQRYENTAKTKVGRLFNRASLCVCPEAIVVLTVWSVSRRSEAASTKTDEGTNERLRQNVTLRNMIFSHNFVNCLTIFGESEIETLSGVRVAIN